MESYDHARTLKRQKRHDRSPVTRCRKGDDSPKNLQMRLQEINFRRNLWLEPLKEELGVTSSPFERVYKLASQLRAKPLVPWKCLRTTLPQSQIGQYA